MLEPGGIIQWGEVVEDTFERVVSPGVSEGDMPHLAAVFDKHNSAYTSGKRMKKLDSSFEQVGLEVLDRHRLPLNLSWLKYETDLSMWTQQEFTATPRTNMDQASLMELDQS